MRKIVLLFILTLFTSCKLQYKTFEDGSKEDEKFTDLIDGTQDYFDLFIVVDKSLNGNKLFIEQGTSAFYDIIYDDFFTIDNKQFKLIKVENTKNIKIHLNDEFFFPINIGKYKEYRFLYLTKNRSIIQLKFSNIKPENLSW